MKEKMFVSDLKQIAAIGDQYVLPIDERSASVYLRREEAEKLTILGHFVKKIPSNAKFNGDGDQYLIYHTEGCHLPGITKKLSSQFSISQPGIDKNLIGKVKCVRSFEPFDDTVKTLTRSNRQLTHYLYPPFQRSLVSFFPGVDTVHSLGYNGRGQCAALLDTGIDVNTPWFTDNNGNSIINSTFMSHRKIKSMLPFGDYQDDEDGHGTFLAALIAGKPKCMNLGTSYDGIASESKLFIVDLKKKNETSYSFPKHFADIVEVPAFFDCKIQLNAWSTHGSPLLTQAIDTIAYNNPSVLMIFPAEEDKSTSRIKSPADAKNVLTVGEVSGYSSKDSMSIIVTTLSGSAMNFVGYEDPNGKSINSLSIKPYNGAYLIGNSTGCIYPVGNETDIPDNISMLFVFGEDQLESDYSIPIVRFPEQARPHLIFDTKVLLIPSFYPSDDKNRPYRQITDASLTTSRVFKIKPEIFAPGGPLLSAKSGSKYCSDELLTEKSGVSISAAIITADSLLIRQYLVEIHGIKSPSGHLIKAALIHSSQDLSGYNTSTQGWGTPFLENILPLGTNSGVSTNIHFSNDVNISSSEYHSYCFNVTSEGVVKVTVSWSDLPRDPYSLIDVASPLSLRIVVDEQNSNAALANNKDSDMPTIDVFNTVQQAEKKVSIGQRVKIIVVASKFALDRPATYSMVISAPTPAKYFSNMTCDVETGPTCGRDCVFRGSCVDGFCKCLNDRAGDFCGTKVEKISGGNAWRGALRRFEWVILKYIPRGWEKGSKIRIPLDSIRKSHFGLRINVGSPPTWSQALCTEDYCVGGEFDGDYLYLPFENWEFINQKSPLMIGIFSTSQEPTYLDFVLDVVKN